MNWRVSLTNLNAGFPASIGSLATLSKGVLDLLATIDGKSLATLDSRQIGAKR